MFIQSSGLGATKPPNSALSTLRCQAQERIAEIRPLHHAIRHLMMCDRTCYSTAPQIFVDSPKVGCYHAHHENHPSAAISCSSDDASPLCGSNDRRGPRTPTRTLSDDRPHVRPGGARALACHTGGQDSTRPLVHS